MVDNTTSGLVADAFARLDRRAKRRNLSTDSVARERDRLILIAANGGVSVDTLSQCSGISSAVIAAVLATDQGLGQVRGLSPGTLGPS